MLLLDADGPFEQAIGALTPYSERRTKLHCEEFLLIPLADDPFLVEALKGSGVLVAEDARTHPATNKEIVGAAGIVTIVCVPLVLEERTLGVLSVGTLSDVDGLVPDASQSAYLAELADHVAVAVDRVRVLGERRDAETGFRRGEQRYRRFVESSVEGVWAQDETGSFTYVSDGMAELLATDPEELLGQSVRDFLFEEDISSFDEFLVSHRQQKQDTHELRLRRNGGSPTWLLLSATPIFDDSGLFCGLFVMVTDISRRKEAELETVRLVGELSHMLEGIVEALSATTDHRDPYTAIHQQRVTRLACAIAKELGLDEDATEGLRIAALLHDIGKIAVPAEILNKPGTLSELEMGIIRTHATIGHEMLHHVAFDQPVAEMVLQHHERLDGSGYPDGLFGEEIPFHSRILAVADVVEAMMSHRPYRPSLGMDVALAEVREHAGTKYDASVVAACVEVVTAAGGLPEE